MSETEVTRHIFVEDGGAGSSDEAQAQGHVATQQKRASMHGIDGATTNWKRRVIPR
jgi:hypothetical protein